MCIVTNSIRISSIFMREKYTLIADTKRAGRTPAVLPTRINLCIKIRIAYFTIIF